MEYLASRKVLTLGCDSPSMGPIPDLAEPTHIAGLKHGMIWAEGLSGLDQLPATGAFYCCIGPKHEGGPYSEGRAFALVGPLAAQLIESARKKNVVDLSVLLSPDLPVWWPGASTGEHSHPYLKVPFAFAPNLGRPHETHVFDSHTGTHLVPPAFALPPEGFDHGDYAPEVRGWLAEYEKKYGTRGTSISTTEKVPIAQTCGPARVVDVRPLLGTTDKRSWPASPEITAAFLQKHEKQHGEFKTGEVVVFHSGWSDRYLKPFPRGCACMADPLEGKSEGWPAHGAGRHPLSGRPGHSMCGDRWADAWRRRAEAGVMDLLDAWRQRHGWSGVPDQRSQPAARRLFPLCGDQNPWLSWRTGPSDRDWLGVV